jgi:hypothetical protein
MTAGALYSALEKYSISAFDTSGADRFDAYYRDAGSSFTKVASQQSWDPDSYDNDSGTLQDMTAAYYACLWFYVETDGHVVCLYGRNEYATLAEAVAENPPDTLPDRLDATGMLMGRYIFVKSATDPTQIDTAFPPPVGGGTAADHGALVGLGDDDHGQYAKLLGRTGGQTLYGSPSASEHLYLLSNSTATLGNVYVGGNTATPIMTVATAGMTMAANINMGNNDITGVDDITGNGGSIFSGGTGAGEHLYLQSTTHATHGNIYLGANDYYDEVNEDLYINISETAGKGIQGGAAFIGSWPSAATAAVFCNEDLKASANDFCLLHDSVGNTYLNASSTKQIYFEIAAGVEATLSSTAFTLSGVNLAMSNNDITGVDDITGNGGSIFSGGTSASADLYLQSTTNGTKGKIYLGSTDYYDEANTKLVLTEIEGTAGLILDGSGSGVNIQSGVTVWVSVHSAEIDVYKNLNMNGQDIIGVDDITGNGGSVISGGTGVGDDLYLYSTTNGTKGTVFLGDSGGITLGGSIDAGGFDITNIDDITGNGASILSGGTGSGDDLYLQSTTHATKGYVFVDGERPLIGHDDRCHAYETGGVQSINNNTWTAITLDSERFDPNGLHDTSINLSRITIAESGTYLVGGNIGWAAHASDQTRRIISLSVNGVPGVGTEIARQENHVSTAGATGMTGQSVVTLWSFSASDYVELCVLQTSGGALNTAVSAAYSPELWVQRVST